MSLLIFFIQAHLMNNYLRPQILLCTRRWEGGRRNLWSLLSRISGFLVDTKPVHGRPVKGIRKWNSRKRHVHESPSLVALRTRACLPSVFQRWAFISGSLTLLCSLTKHPLKASSLPGTVLGAGHEESSLEDPALSSRHGWAAVRRCGWRS